MALGSRSWSTECLLDPVTTSALRKQVGSWSSLQLVWPFRAEHHDTLHSLRVVLCSPLPKEVQPIADGRRATLWKKVFAGVTLRRWRCVDDGAPEEYFVRGPNNSSLGKSAHLKGDYLHPYRKIVQKMASNIQITIVTQISDRIFNLFTCVFFPFTKGPGYFKGFDRFPPCVLGHVLIFD